jgi:hypothetical protein
MALLPWSKKSNRVPPRQGAADKKKCTRKCFLEILEDRTLLSGQTFIVNSSTDFGIGSGTTGDIRYCINQADQPANLGSTITFGAVPGGVITLTRELQISQNMTIQGPGAAG